MRSGSVAFDALFAHTISEMKELSVDAIRDGAYNDDQPIACHCFETGEKWHYVWTRDLSYGANLGLAMLDPRRVRDSLTFKLSGYRAGSTRPLAAAGTADGLQIIQDTGSGGSWPVSTDRVTWAFGAEQALTALSGPERLAFGVTALKALSNTIDNDRIAAFDPRDGLYTGEQSFLDWREQSYGRDIETDLARMATSKALSTNVAHYDGAALHKYDGLGLSLAIVTGIADPARPHPGQLSARPGGGAGHLPAAAGRAGVSQSRHLAVRDRLRARCCHRRRQRQRGRRGLRLAAARRGPVVNSRRQLWSVGAYVGMVVRNVFGVRYADDGVHVAPFITARLRRDSVKHTDRIVLNDLSVRGKKLAVRVALPPVASGPLFAPREAVIAHAVAAVTGIDVGIADVQQAGPVVYRLYRNGVLVADQLKQPAWRDLAPLAQANCYAVEVVDAISGNVSHHSGAVCAEAGIKIDVARSGERIANWGAPQDRFSFQVRYTNHGQAINTGISNGVKVLSVLDAGGHTVAWSVIKMPHLPPDSQPMYSTPADILLKAGTYSVRLDDFYNMSYLEANAVYANGGGKGGALNKVDLFGLRILPLAGQ